MKLNNSNSKYCISNLLFAKYITMGDFIRNRCFRCNLLLVFKDTILGLVASIQVYSGNLIKEGDWIELKNLDIDGEVLEVGLHRVKVKAWDNSITTFPTAKFLELTFKNWRNMQESGGRRIKRNIIIKVSSIKFLDTNF